MDFPPNLEDGDLLHPAKNTLIKGTLKTIPDQSLLKVANMDHSSMSLKCSETLTLANIESFPDLQLGQSLLNDEIEGLTQNSFEISQCVDDIYDLTYLNAVTPANWTLEESSTICCTPVMDELCSKTEVSLESVDKPSLSNDSQITEQPAQACSINELINIKMTDSDYETFHDLQSLLEMDTFDQTSETITIHPDINSMPELLQTAAEISHLSVASSSTGSSSELKEQNTQVESDISEEYSTPNKRSKICTKSTHEKYIEMRKKNNIASRRSRQLRKEKEREMEIEEVKLEKENKLLKLTVKDLERRRDTLKSYLIRKLSGL